MISLINGHCQSPQGLPIIPLGYMELSLNVDATIIAPPYGQVMAGIPFKIYFDSSANVITTGGQNQIWSNLELNPQQSPSLLGTLYNVNFYDQNGCRVNQNPLQWQFPNAAGSTVDISSMTAFNNGGIIYYPVPLGGLPASAQLGDTIRWNVNGDNAWDGSNASQWDIRISAVNQSVTAIYTGIFGNGSPSLTGSISQINPTATSNASLQMASAATMSTSTVIGFSHGQNGSVSLIGMTAFYRWTFKASIGNLANARYWFGLGCFNNSGVGNNPLTIVGSTAYASDSPNKSTIGFRFSAGTDTHWQAVACTAGGSQTTVDTGIVPDTNTHIFEMSPNLAGTAINFLIDGAAVATISTNIPPASGTSNSWGTMFVTGDNKNTNTAVALTWFYMNLSLR